MICRSLGFVAWSAHSTQVRQKCITLAFPTMSLPHSVVSRRTTTRYLARLLSSQFNGRYKKAAALRRRSGKRKSPGAPGIGRYRGCSTVSPQTRPRRKPYRERHRSRWRRPSVGSRPRSPRSDASRLRRRPRSPWRRRGNRAAAAVILLPSANIHAMPMPIRAADTGFFWMASCKLPTKSDVAEPCLEAVIVPSPWRWQCPFGPA